MAAYGGPSKFGVVYRGEGAVLVELVDVLCNLETKTPCGADASAAQGYLIRESLGGPEAVVPKDQAAPLVVGTPIYAYAIGEAPAENAKKEYERLGANLDEKLASMGALETEVITAFERFAQAPTVDDGSVQPDAQ